MLMEKQLIKTSFNEPDGRHLLKNHSRMQRKGKQVNTGVAFTGAKLVLDCKDQCFTIKVLAFV